MYDQQLIANRYQLGQLLSEGGMGAVYRGIDTQSNQAVAIKHLSIEKSTDQHNMIERFSREADALHALNHPNIVKVLDTVTKDEEQYIIMEFVGGGSLRELLDREGQISFASTVDIALDLADALTRAHRLEIIHRDLKPANILLAMDGSPRLSDFGIAKVSNAQLFNASRLTQTGIIIGTPDYLSPEACRGEALDARTDIWALGIILFEMLTGKRPFPYLSATPTIAATLSAILTQPTPNLEALCKDIPIRFVDLIYRMLMKDREARIPSMRLVGAELEAIRQGENSTQYDVIGLGRSSRFATPTPLPIGIPQHNLPEQTTPFIGRDVEMTSLARLIADPANRLITILGPGGAGKTRLALETARKQLPNFEGGVTFVPLAPLSLAENIISAIAEAIGFQFFESVAPKRQIMDWFRNRQALILLDNFEHILDGAQLVREILQAAPDIKVLVTSREKLNLQEEIRFRIEGMQVPEEAQPISVKDAYQYSAIRLFMQAAKRARPSYELETEDLGTIRHICHLVRGMPLGILLAAAWVEMFSPQEITKEIDRSLDFLATEVSDIPERHRSIRAVFDSTWNQLTKVEQETFMKLAIFRGGFRREAAQVIAEANLQKLINLVSKSLLHRDPSTGRYEIHELLRQYAEEQLQASGKFEATVHAHCQYYAAFMGKRRSEMLSPRQTKALNEIEDEFENIRQAWHWAVEQKNFEAIDQALESLFIYSDMRSREYEGVALIGLARKRLAPKPGEEPHPVWGHLLLPWFDLMIQSEGCPQDNQKFKTLAETCLALAQNKDDDLGKAYALILLGHFNKPTDAIKMYEEALKLVPRLDDSFWVRIRIGFCHRALGEHQKEIKAFQQSFQRGSEIGESEKMGYGLYNLGESEMLLGNYASALTHFREAHTYLHQVGTLWGVILTNINLSLVTLLMGDLQQTRLLVEETQKIANDASRSDLIQKKVLTVLGYLALIEQDYQKAKYFFEEILSAQLNLPEASLGLTFIACEQEDYAVADKNINDALQPTSPFMVPAMMILCLPAAALIINNEGNRERAIELLALAYEHPQGPKNLLDKWPLIMQLKSNLKIKLQPEKFNAAWARGQVLDLTETLSNLVDRFQVELDTNQTAYKHSQILRYPDEPIIEPLSERELDVLRLLKTELSGPEIASELSVSLNTVRFHTKNIYAKLHVNNRRSAVNRALELGL